MQKKEQSKEHSKVLKLEPFPKHRQQIAEIADYFKVSHSLALQIAIADVHDIFSKRKALKRYDTDTRDKTAKNFFLIYDETEDGKIDDILDDKEIFYSDLARLAISDFYMKFKSGRLNYKSKAFAHYLKWPAK
ncbi:hypothetical protein [Burkholderia cenocepacia]|uniref:hypothetical protein n=1 Tax=Burkholderia cenocepacia TaxID=95486 RepID=UPI001B96CEF0|nr:hypothetical protein [Burkholderia cenocepacia]MBR8495142.1 hypothetical protein [Burkholderia cenocepacia]